MLSHECQAIYSGFYGAADSELRTFTCKDTTTDHRQGINPTAPYLDL
jgi:hypothetical protein